MSTHVLIVLLVIAALGAPAQAESLEVQEVQAALARCDRRLARLDADSARALATSTADLPAIERAYGEEVARRQNVLDSALDLLFPVAHHLASGSLLSLDSALVSHNAAALGMYAPDEFRRRIGGGVYLAEAFDPARDVILCVHGIHGTPADYRGFIGSVDRARYQVWFAYYPTGEKIPAMAHALHEALAAELARHPARRVWVICHSLGGLVFRTLLARDGFPGPLATVTYVSTPHRGVRFAPMPVVRVACRWLWRVLPAEVDDLLEGSDYLAALNAAPAPGVRVRTAGGDAWKSAKARMVGPFIPGADDGLVPTDSTPLAGSASYRVFHEDHYSILSSPEFQRAYAGWLAEDAR